MVITMDKEKQSEIRDALLVIFFAVGGATAIILLILLILKLFSIN